MSNEIKTYYSKIYQGPWGVQCNYKYEIGTTVEVSKKDGTTVLETLTKLHTTKQKYNYNTHEYETWYIYLIEPSSNKKYSYASKGGKKSISTYSKAKPAVKYKLYTWKYVGEGVEDKENPNVKDYELEAVMEGMDKAVVESLMGMYKEKYICFGKSDVSININSHDLHQEDHWYVVGDLYEAWLAKKEAEENKERFWLFCKMQCSTLPTRSQKAKGVKEITQILRHSVDMSVVDTAKVASYNGDIEGVIHKCSANYDHSGYKYGGYGSNRSRYKLDEIIDQVVGQFMRPCPQSPEHGFVDSRLVKSKEEVEGVIKEIEVAGEIPEFIVMPLIKCDYSGVITPDSIALGPKNDGATAGKGAITFPLQLDTNNLEYYRKLFWENNEAFCSNCHKTWDKDRIGEVCCVGEKGVKYEISWKYPYAEVLYQGVKAEPSIVQLRAGPSQTLVEENVKVKYVVEVSGEESSPLFYDLIEWGKKAKELAKDVEVIEGEGYDKYSPIVWHPNGAPSSHYGVHCREKKIPYTISIEKPVVGEVVKVGVKNPANIQAFKEGCILGLETSIDVSNYHSVVIKRWLKNFLGALHLYALADIGNPEVARFIGYSWSLGGRIISALPFGETVHNKGAREYVKNMLGENVDAFPTSERDYVRVWKMDLEGVISGLVACFQGFKNKSYHWSSGYGGDAWANCTLALIEVFVGIKELIEDANPTTLGKLVEVTNVMVNLAHNGGWWLDKILSKSDFDNAAVLPHFSIDPEIAFRAKTDYEKIKGFMLKVKGFSMSNKIVVSNDIKECKVVEDPKAKGKGLTFVDKSYMDEDVVETPKYTQEQIKEMIDFSSAIEAQYMSDNNMVHIQIKCMTINREYGYSGSYWTNNEFKNQGNVVKSLTGSGKDYHQCVIYNASKGIGSGMNIAIEVGGKYVVVQDGEVFVQLKDIQKWQVEGGKDA